MKNAILPSVSSQICSYGNSEPIVDIPVQMDNKLNFYGSGFSTGPKVYNDYNQLKDGAFAIPPQSTITYQPGSSSLVTIKGLDYPYLGGGYLTTASSHDNISDHQPLSICKKLLIPQYENDFRATVATKRSLEADVSEWKTNKKAVLFQDQWLHQFKEELKEVHRQRVPVRRSQKLSDRITALQKLVSPYGKTDTASVLQEASISIKVLQDQIQNLFKMSSAPYTSTKPLQSQKSGESQVDELRSRGLCLVPVSFIQKLIKENPS